MKTFNMLMKWVFGTIAIVALCSVAGMSQNSPQPKLNDAEIASAAVTANQIDVNSGAGFFSRDGLYFR